MKSIEVSSTWGLDVESVRASVGSINEWAKAQGLCVSREQQIPGQHSCGCTGMKLQPNSLMEISKGEVN